MNSISVQAPPTTASAAGDEGTIIKAGDRLTIQRTSNRMNFIGDRPPSLNKGLFKLTAGTIAWKYLYIQYLNELLIGKDSMSIQISDVLVEMRWDYPALELEMSLLLT